MTSPSHDSLETPDLPVLDMDPQAAERIRLVARAELSRSGRRGLFDTAGRAALPVVLATVTFVYLSWAVSAANLALGH